jgi:Arc/MetJ family transcription regulator
MVYVSRTNIEIDDDLIASVMRRYGLRTKREAVEYALREVAPKPLTREEFLAFEGIGWDGDLDEMRQADEIAEL